MTLRQSSSTGSLASVARECVQQRHPTASRLTVGRNHTASSGDVAEGAGQGSARQERQLDPRNSQRLVDLGVGRDPFQQLMFEKALLSSRFVNSSSGSPPLGVAGTSGLLGGTTRVGKTIPTVRSTGNLKSASSRTHSLTGHRHGHGMHVPQSARPSNSVLPLKSSLAPLTSVRAGLSEIPTDPDTTACKASVRICEAYCDGNTSTSVPSASTPLPPPPGEHILGEALEAVGMLQASTPLPPPSGERILGEALEAVGMQQAKSPTRKPYGSRLENKPLGLPLRHRICSLAEKQRVMGTSPENGMANPRFIWGDWDGPTPKRQLRQARPPPSAASLSMENLQAHEMEQHTVVRRRKSRDRKGSGQMYSAGSASSLHSERSSCSSRKQQSTTSATSLSQSLSLSKSLGKEARSASQPTLQRPTWSELVAEGERLGASLRAQADQQSGTQHPEPYVQNASC